MKLSESWRRRGHTAVIVALADLTLFNVYQVATYQVYQARSQWPDFLYFYSFARTGLVNGYQHLYDPVAQAAAVHADA